MCFVFAAGLMSPPLALFPSQSCAVLNEVEGSNSMGLVRAEAPRGGTSVLTVSP